MTGKQIASLMRRHKQTIRSLAEQTGFTVDHVRTTRRGGLSCPFAIRDWVEAITGTDPGGTPEWFAKRDRLLGRP